jgi:hypothetical protein
LCEYLEQHFAVFKRGGGDGKPELTAHFEEWGWINFLSSIAETKVFDIPGEGLDSIECAKRAKAFKVLIYASEKRDYQVALNEAYKTQ